MTGTGTFEFAQDCIEAQVQDGWEDMTLDHEGKMVAEPPPCSREELWNMVARDYIRDRWDTFSRACQQRMKNHPDYAMKVPEGEQEGEWAI